MRHAMIRALVVWLVAAVSATPALAARRPACCRVPAGTVVQVELADEVSTRTQKTGDSFALRLAEPLSIDGRLLVPAGAKGVGEVVEASRPGIGGKPAKLVLAARYIVVGQRRVMLQGLQLAEAGRSRTAAAGAVGLTGMIFGPLGFVGLAVKGGEADFPVGTRANAQVASAITLAALGPAPATPPPPAVATSGDPYADAADAAPGAIDIPPPPAGKGQVVFFRKYGLLSTGQWFKVRENGQALGKLYGGTYFVQVTDPGQHTYTSTFEPELKDHLTLEIAPGQTYYVEGTTSKALLIGAADLAPVDRVEFNRDSHHMKLAAPLGDDKDGDRGDDTPANSTATPK